MTTATQPREPEMGLTFEKVWAMFQESDRYMRKLSEETDRKIRELHEETDRELQETARQIRELKEENKETARRIRESSEETDRKIRELHEETDREMKETARRIRESSEETDRKIRELSEENKETARRIRESSEKTDREIQETARQIRKENKETNRKIRKANIQIGGLHNSFGELAEHLVAPNIAEKFNALGFHFNYMSARLREIMLGKDNQQSAEFDILLENKESVIGVEVKTKPSEEDVKDHVWRLEKLRRYKDEIGDKRKIYGALAGAIMLDGVKNAILNAGLYAITQSGDTVKINVPEGFKPKVW